MDSRTFSGRHMIPTGELTHCTQPLPFGARLSVRWMPALLALTPSLKMAVASRRPSVIRPRAALLNEVLFPEPGRRIDLLDDIDPGAGWINYSEPALAPGLIMPRVSYLHTATLEAPELRRRILHLQGEQQPFPVERIATGR